MPGKIVSPEEWRVARVQLLQKEKEHTKAGDALAAEIRELPVVPVTKEYTFAALDGSTKTLKDLFGDKVQLVIYHFMFDPEWDEGCRGCSFMGAHLPDARFLGSRNTAFFAVSRAPPAKITAFKQKTGWKFPWVSSNPSDFNYDFQATLDERVRSNPEYNFETKEELVAKGQNFNTKGEQPGFSVFKLEDGQVYHTYSAYGRGLDKYLTTLSILDMTPLGRQDGPMGPGEFKRSDEFDREEA